MSLFKLLIICAIAALGLVSLVHSIYGEKLLLRPMFKYRGNRVLENDLARMVLRFAWHLTSLLWILLAVIIYTVGFSPQHLTHIILLSVGIVFTAVGMFDLIVSRGRHVGWPILMAIGAFCMGAYSLLGTST